MLLTITYTGKNTQDLGYLLYKNPYRAHSFSLNHGNAYVFYPEVSDERTTAALLLDINPIDLVRGKADQGTDGLFRYVNDRPYVASSFLSTAISRVYGTAMSGKGGDHQELADSPLDLEATISALPIKGWYGMVKRVFEPLGYEVIGDGLDEGEEAETPQHQGRVRYTNLTIKGKVRLRDLLKHLFVLIPVFDRQKHYWIGSDEVDKLLRLGEDWLPTHPEKNYITMRYLNRQHSLVHKALNRLLEMEGTLDDDEETDEVAEEAAEEPEVRVSLNKRRIDTVVEVLKNHGVKRVIDIGCGEGNLLRQLVKEPQFISIAGVDVSIQVLERANSRLRLDQAGDYKRNKMNLFHSSLMYKDARFEGYDAACVIEVIEHMDLAKLKMFERVLFEFSGIPMIVLTTPNKEYNDNYENLQEGRLRHHDHRFEWTRAEFREWANRIASDYGYTVEFSDIGDADEERGTPTQMGVFTR